MTHDSVRDWLHAAERATPEEQWALLGFLAGQHVELDEDERDAALRRAWLLLAAGGDPRRRLELYGRAVTALAEDLDAPERRAALADGLRALAPVTSGLAGATEALEALLRDPDLAWQCYAMALVAEDIADDDASAT